MATYRVLMHDSLHFSGGARQVEHGAFATAAEAVACGRALVDAALAGLHRRGMTADDLLEGYFALGHEPIIASPPGQEQASFSAWDYAAKQAASICTEIDA